ncbi:MAG: GNAT family N-acetyltransferase [Mycobacteriales bacterium]
MTKRANSVLPRRAPADLDAAVAEVERFYARRGLPACFQLGGSSEPASLDAELAARGYRRIDPTLLMTAPVAGLLALPATGPQVEVGDAPTDEWMALWQRVDGRYPPDLLPRAMQIMTGVPAGYGLLRAGPAGGEAVAVGRAVVLGEWVGVYAMAVDERWRGRGYGRAVLRGLAGWAAGRGARRAFLVVVESNAAARRLYGGAGFTAAGRYHYRVRCAS